MEQGLLLSFIQNSALLLAIVLIYDAFPRRYKHKKDVMTRVGVGLLVGGITIALMLMPWEYSEGVFFDSRTVILSICGIFFGGIATFVAVAVSAVYRLVEGGATLVPGIGAIVTSGLLGYVWGRYRKGKLSDVGFSELFFFGLFCNAIILLWGLSLPAEFAITLLKQVTIPFLVIFPITTALLGLLLSRRIEIKRDQKIKLQDQKA